MTGVQLRAAFDDITIWSALKYSVAPSELVELNGMVTLGGEHGAAVTMLMMSSNWATSVTLFFARTDTLKIPKELN